MELDLICPRPPRLICTPFSTATHVLSKEKIVQHIQDVMVFCRITIWRHGGGKLFSYVAWHYENLRSCIHTFVHILSLLKLVGCFFFFFFQLTSRKTSNQVRIISLFLLVSYCIHYPAEYLHLWCIPAVQRELQFLNQQPKCDTMPGFNGAFMWLSRSYCCE